MSKAKRREREASRPKRVLLAEDDADLRGLLAETVRAQGWLVTECPNGLDLVETLVSSLEPGSPRFDLVVADVRMPGVTGISVLEELCEWDELRNLPMILITAFADARLHEAARKLGAVSLLEKPFEMSALLDAARNATDGIPSEIRS